MLDTNILLHMARGSGPGQFLLSHPTFSSRKDLATSVVCVAEMTVLATRNNWGQKKKDAFTSALEQLTIVDIVYPSRILEHYVQIDCATQHASLGKNDLWIASTAAALGMTVVTADKDFSRIPETLVTVHLLDPDAPNSWTVPP